MKRRLAFYPGQFLFFDSEEVTVSFTVSSVSIIKSGKWGYSLSFVSQNIIANISNTSARYTGPAQVLVNVDGDVFELHMLNRETLEMEAAYAGKLYPVDEDGVVRGLPD